MSIREWAAKLKKNIRVLFLVFQHESTPWHVKSLAAVTLGYALSPIDLVPDFIPVFGFLDDLLILPLMIAACMKLTPAEVIDECREQAAMNDFSFPAKRWVYSLPVLAIWAWALWKFFRIFA